MSTMKLRETETRRFWNLYIVYMILISEQKVAAHGCGVLVYALGCPFFYSFKIFVRRLDFKRQDTEEYFKKYHIVFSVKVPYSYSEVGKNIYAQFL